MSLHPLDRRWKNPSSKKLDEMMVFCILDSRTPYKRVCNTFDLLKMKQELDGCEMFRMSEWIGAMKISRLVQMLRRAGYPYYNQKAKYLMLWARSDYTEPKWLRTASRDEIADKITGIGMKLASMFVRNTRNEPVAVLDTHILKWIGHPGTPKDRSDYKQLEDIFLEKAFRLNRDPYDLDIEIWDQMRVKT